ncbi:unnamed protein product, partial [Arabidopsis halleri]
TLLGYLIFNFGLGLSRRLKPNQIYDILVCSSSSFKIWSRMVMRFHPYNSLNPTNLTKWFRFFC